MLKNRAPARFFGARNTQMHSIFESNVQNFTRGVDGVFFKDRMEYELVKYHYDGLLDSQLISVKF